MQLLWNTVFKCSDIGMSFGLVFASCGGSKFNVGTASSPLLTIHVRVSYICKSFDYCCNADS